MTALGQEDKWVEKEWSLGERFGANVVWFGRQIGLTQTQLADRIGMTRTLLSHIERGRRLPRLSTILKLVAALEVENCDLVAWMWWDPASHRHYETPPSIADISGYEVRDFHLPAGFRVSPVGYESEERFKDRLKQREEPFKRCWTSWPRAMHVGQRKAASGDPPIPEAVGFVSAAGRLGDCGKGASSRGRPDSGAARGADRPPFHLHQPDRVRRR